MNRETTGLIVLNTVRYGDSAVIIQALSPKYGRCGLIAKGVGRGRNNGRSSALFQPLSILEAEVGENPKSSLLTLYNAYESYSYSTVRTDMYKAAISLFMCELLYRVIKDGAREDGLFEWVKEMAGVLDRLESNYANFHLYFAVGLCSALGFRPNDNYSDTNRIFSVESADFSSSGNHFSERNSLFLHRLLSLDFADCMMIPATGEQRLSFMEDMLRFLEFHSDMLLDVKSLKVLHEVLC